MRVYFSKIMVILVLSATMLGWGQQLWPLSAPSYFDSLQIKELVLNPKKFHNDQRIKTVLMRALKDDPSYLIDDQFPLNIHLLKLVNSEDSSQFRWVYIDPFAGQIEEEDIVICEDRESLISALKQMSADWRDRRRFEERIDRVGKPLVWASAASMLLKGPLLSMLDDAVDPEGQNAEADSALQSASKALWKTLERLWKPQSSGWGADARQMSVNVEPQHIALLQGINELVSGGLWREFFITVSSVLGDSKKIYEPQNRDYFRYLLTSLDDVKNFYPQRYADILARQYELYRSSKVSYSFFEYLLDEAIDLAFAIDEDPQEQLPHLRPRLQKLMDDLKLIQLELEQRGVVFQWKKEHQELFDQLEPFMPNDQAQVIVDAQGNQVVSQQLSSEQFLRALSLEFRYSNAGGIRMFVGFLSQNLITMSQQAQYYDFLFEIYSIAFDQCLIFDYHRHLNDPKDQDSLYTNSKMLLTTLQEQADKLQLSYTPVKFFDKKIEALINQKEFVHADFYLQFLKACGYDRDARFAKFIKLRDSGMQLQKQLSLTLGSEYQKLWQADYAGRPLYIVQSTDPIALDEKKLGVLLNELARRKKLISFSADYAEMQSQGTLLGVDSWIPLDRLLKALARIDIAPYEFLDVLSQRPQLFRTWKNFQFPAEYQELADKVWSIWSVRRKSPAIWTKILKKRLEEDELKTQWRPMFTRFMHHLVDLAAKDAPKGIQKEFSTVHRYLDQGFSAKTYENYRQTYLEGLYPNILFRNIKSWLNALGKKLPKGKPMVIVVDEVSAPALIKQLEKMNIPKGLKKIKGSKLVTVEPLRAPFKLDIENQAHASELVNQIQTRTNKLATKA